MNEQSQNLGPNVVQICRVETRTHLHENRNIPLRMTSSRKLAVRRTRKSYSCQNGTSLQFISRGKDGVLCTAPISRH